jgi:hypothetical protein
VINIDRLRVRLFKLKKRGEPASGDDMKATPMIPLREYFRGVELVWLVWLALLLILVGTAIRVLRHFRRPRVAVVHQDEEGASYTLAYVMVIPIYLLFLCLVVEASLLLIAKVGTLYAAHAGARSMVVWDSMPPTELRDERSRQAVFTAMAGFTSSSPRHLRFSIPPKAFQQAAEFVLVYKMYSRASESQPGPRRPYTRINPTARKLFQRYLVAASRTTIRYDVDRSNPEGPIRCTVTYLAPLYIPGSARILDPDGSAPYDYPIVSIVTLPNEAPISADGTLGIEYESR